MASNSVGVEDVLFHALFIGSTGAGKINALLYWLLKLFSTRKDVALVLIDPHGDAAFDHLLWVHIDSKEAHCFWSIKRPRVRAGRDLDWK